MAQALAGIRVLDFTRVLAGPLCTMLLGDLGAEVVKVENPDSGDDTRAWGPPWFSTGENRQSAYFAAVNRNKRSITLNLKSLDGQDIARQLARHSHIVIENFKPRQMASYGLGFEDLKYENPALVYCSITGYGQTGPYRDRPGYDYVIQAMSGLMSITGDPQGEPAKVGVAIADVLAGLFALSAIQAALFYSYRTGEGQYIDISLLDSQIAALVNVASNYLVSGEIPARYGHQHANIVPYQTFHARDGAFVVAVGNDRQFSQLCELLNQPQLAQDPRFATNPARVEHRDELIALLSVIFQTRMAEEWVNDLLKMGIPTGPIYTIDQALNDPQVQAREMVQSIDTLTGALLRLVGSPYKFSATPAQIHSAPPLLGQHTDAILREVLHYDEAQIAAYRQRRII